MSSQPSEDIEQLVNAEVRCRELQIYQLAILVASPFPSPPNVVVHGTPSTGKSLTVRTLLQHSSLPFAIVRSAECITTRQLLEQALFACKEGLIAAGREAEALPKIDGRCENIAVFIGQLQTLLRTYDEKFVLVFDGIDRQREAAPTLLPALARMGEMIPNLTTLFLVISPFPSPFSLPGIPHVNFPAYTRAESISLVSYQPLPISSISSEEDNKWLWTRFVEACWNTLGQAVARDLPSFSRLCKRLWPEFVKPITEGLYRPREFSKLMIRHRALFQSESALSTSIVSSTITAAPTTSSHTSHRSALLATSSHTLKLPTLPSHLLIVAFLCSTTPPRLDATLFSKHSTSRKRRRRGGPQTPSGKKGQAHYTPQKARKKLSKHQTSAQAFPLERLWAVAHAIVPPGVLRAGAMESMVQWKGLERLGLVGTVGLGGEGIGESKWRCGVGKEVILGVARRVRFDLEEFLVE